MLGKFLMLYHLLEHAHAGAFIYFCQPIGKSLVHADYIPVNLAI
jgi:hypothetical protein